MSLFPFMMEPSVTSLKTTTYRSEKLHLYLIEKDEMEKKVRIPSSLGQWNSTIRQISGYVDTFRHSLT
jgi:hypothetical protein